MSEEEKFEKEIKIKLKKETNKVTGLKEGIWNNITLELFPSNFKKTRTNWVKGFAATISAVAVVTIMLFVLLKGNLTDKTQHDPIQGNPTQHDLDQGVNDPDTEQEEEDRETLLKDQFVHEKQIEIELEGMKESIHVQLATNEELRYIIYFDKDSYQFIHGEEIDEIVPINKLDDQYPEVAMEIQHMPGSTIDEVLTNIKESLADEGMSIVHEESVNWPVDAVMIAGEGNKDGVVEWDTPVHRYYIIEGENDSLFVFKQMFFVEAWEGHATRFDQMLESFEIVQ